LEWVWEYPNIISLGGQNPSPLHPIVMANYLHEWDSKRLVFGQLHNTHQITRVKPLNHIPIKPLLTKQETILWLADHSLYSYLYETNGVFLPLSFKISISFLFNFNILTILNKNLFYSVFKKCNKIILIAWLISIF
jgi:hypothetical protein